MIRLKSLKAQGIKNLEIPSEDDDFERLEFPEEGEVFIHGLNEAGKSTLFESIYFALFGTALIPDRSRASMSELLAYDRDKGVVELEFLVQDSLYRIRRSIDDSKSRTDYTHKLVIEHPGEDPEGVTGARNVNQRIEQELGLDGDALLNSCFVQQKNLDRLEDSSRQKREDSIATLLNLDRFTAMENDYGSKQSEAEEGLERAKQKREIAEIEEEKIPDKIEEKEEVEAKLDVIQWKKDVKERKRDITGYKDRIEGRVDEIHGLAKQIQEIDRIEEKLPGKEERKQKLDQLHSDFLKFGKLDEAIDELDQLHSLDNDIEELDSKVSELEDERERITKKLGEIRDQLGQYEYLGLLDEWERLKNAATREKRIEEQEEKHQENKEQAEEQLDKVEQQKSKTASKRRTFVGGGAIVAVIGLIAGFSVSPLAYTGILLGLAVAGYGYLSYNPGQYDSDIESLDEEVSTHEDELTKLEGRREDMADIEAEAPSEELDQVEAEIRELDQSVPSTLEECSELQSVVEDALEDVPSKNELVSTEDELVNDRPREKEIESEKEELRNMRKKREDLDKEEIQDRITDLKVEIVGEEKGRDQIKSELVERAEKLDVAPDKEKVNSAKSSLDADLKNDKEQIREREDIEDQIGEKNSKIEELQGDITDAENTIKKLENKIEEADTEPEIERESELEEKRDEIVGDLGDLRGRRNNLRDELNLTEDLSLGDVVEEVEEKEHEVKLYAYAEEIVSRSKKQIMQNILPKTEANMARFLPILTDGRYKDVRIDADSYTIEAYDGRAQAYKSKSIFSGGTKDQFSLALRLSFAMATLPQERGTAPDFLYLDEPVGSFDSNRQESLTELLTRGEIAENFGQIFIVSHVEGLQDEFDHRIKMEDGRITEKELET